MPSGKNCSPQVILLNGTSCAGKTSVAEYLVCNLQEPFDILDWDSFLNRLPADQSISDENRKDLVRLFMDKACERLDRGDNMILDVVCVPANTYQRLHDRFNSYNLLSVRLRADTETLVARETERPDRKNGQAVFQHIQMYEENPHPASLYDLECDSTRDGVAKIGNAIIQKALSPK